MKAAVLNIGDEVLIGDTINTNLSLIAKMARDNNITIEEQITVKDIKDIIISRYNHLKSLYDLVFVTGGLGPTEDDITVETIAEANGLDLVLNTQKLKDLEDRFEQMGRVMAENNKKQAYFPKGAEVFANDYGTASGFSLKSDGKITVVLPGPPVEAKNILEKFFDTIKTGDKVIVTLINTNSIGESDLENRLRKLDLPDKISINTYYSRSGVDIKLIASSKYQKELDPTKDILLEEFGEYVYDIDSPTVAKTLVDTLSRNNKTISFAESMTGGKIGSLYTEWPGASDSLIASLVTYSEKSKEKELGVKRETLDKYTAVSSQVAKEMLDGIIEKYDTDYCGVVTGYASDPGDKDLDGVCFIGVYSKSTGEKNIIKIKNVGSRVQKIDRAAYKIFYEILKFVKQEV